MRFPKLNHHGLVVSPVFWRSVRYLNGLYSTTIGPGLLSVVSIELFFSHFVCFLTMEYITCQSPKVILSALKFWLKCVCALDFYHACHLKRAVGNILHCTERTQNKSKISQWRLLYQGIFMPNHSMKVLNGKMPVIDSSDRVLMLVNLKLGIHLLEIPTYFKPNPSSNPGVEN